MPRGIKGSGKTPNIKRHHFLVTGTVEYTEGAKAEQKLEVNGVHVDVSKDLNAAALGRIQVLLQMHFHTKYQKTHTSPPEITDVTIGSITYLGSFSEKEFLRDAPGTQEEKPEEKKPVTLTSVKERLESEVKADMAAKVEMPTNAPTTEQVQAAAPVEKVTRMSNDEIAAAAKAPMTPTPTGETSEPHQVSDPVAAVAPVIELPATPVVPEVTPEPVKTPLIEMAAEAPKAS